MRLTLRHRRRLRLALMVLLMLAMVVSPMLAAVSGVHDVEHAVAAASEDAHGHAHSATDDHQHHGQDGAGLDPDHASGAHALMHLSPCGSVSMPNDTWALLEIELDEPLLPEFGRLYLPGDSVTLPFRPPIA